MAGEGLYSVNWKNPMVLGDEHLQQADVAAKHAHRWHARGLAPSVGSFGLVTPGRGGGPGLQMAVEHGADRLSVRLRALSGFAPDGHAFDLDAERNPALADEAEASVELERNPARPQRWGVLVEPVDPSGADVQAWAEFGQPSPEEEPPRAPWRAPRLRVSLQLDAFSAGPRLKVAELVWDGIAVEAADDYLPPALNVAASAALLDRSVQLRRSVQALREQLAAAAVAENEESALAGVTAPWLAATASLEDGIPAMAPEVHPYQVWNTTLRVLRVGRTMLGARPDALQRAQREFVQPGKLVSGDSNYFEHLESWMGEPYDHDQLGPSLHRASELLVGMREVVGFLAGAAPVKEEAPAETDVYFYKDKKYKLAPYGARTFEVDEAWHTCYLRELDVEAPKTLLLVCDAGLLVQNPRPNAGLWMLDRYERVKANMFRVNVDNSSDPAKVVALFQDVGGPKVDAVSIASRGLLDLSGLGAEPDERLRIYYQV